MNPFESKSNQKTATADKPEEKAAEKPAEAPKVEAAKAPEVPAEPFVHPKYPQQLSYAPGSPFPKRMWPTSGPGGARLVGSAAEAKSLGEGWTDVAPKPGKPAEAPAKIHSKAIVPPTPEHHDFKSGKHAVKVVPDTPQKEG